jgi:hypothetical protein
MSLIKKIGPDTISSLERAALRRFTEGDWLAEGGHYLAAIYLYGYVSEMVMGIAYFRHQGYGPVAPIHPNTRDRVLKTAKQYVDAEDKMHRSHPIGGWAQLLVEIRRQVWPRAHDEKRMERMIVDRAALICEHWTPQLRYHAIYATLDQATTVREAVEWFLKNAAKL